MTIGDLDGEAILSNAKIGFYDGMIDIFILITKLLYTNIFLIT